MGDIHYNIHHRIDVYADTRLSKSVISAIDFQIGYFRTSDGNGAGSHRIGVKPYDDFESGKDCVFDSFHLFRGVPGRCVVYPDRRLAIQKDENGFTVFTDNSMVITPFVEMMLLNYGVTIVHAAAVADREGDVILFPGAGGVGKTALLGYLMKQPGFKLLGDDNIGIDEHGRCWCLPRSFVLKEYHEEVYPEIFDRMGLKCESDLRRKTKMAVYGLIKILGDNVPFMGLSKWILTSLGLQERVAHRLAVPRKRDFLATVPVAEIFGDQCVIERGMLKRIVFLQRYEGTDFSLEPMSEDELARKMNAIIHHEWVDSMRLLFTLAAFDLMNIEDYFHRIYAIIRSGVVKRKCERLRIPGRASPKDLTAFLFPE